LGGQTIELDKSKYGKYIVTGAKADLNLPSFRHETTEESGGNSTRLIYLDAEVVPGAFYSECAWFWSASGPGRVEAEAHTHSFDELIAFFGTKREAPRDLCGEIELWLENEKHVITKSFVAVIPAGMKHCPLIVRRVDRPIFHFTIGTGKEYG